MDASEAARVLAKQRKKKSGGKGGGRPATVEHVEGGYCRCAVCRKGRGEWGGEKAGEVVEEEKGVKAVEGEHVGRKLPALVERLKEMEGGVAPKKRGEGIDAEGWEKMTNTERVARLKWLKEGG